MKIKRFHIEGLALITRPVHRDDRGSFTETFHVEKLAGMLGSLPVFVQDNLSISYRRDTLRGLHLQNPPFAQAKLVTCISGDILDVVVDVRTDSPTFGQHISVALSGDDGQSLWVPEGFLHGFITRTDKTIVSYKVTAHYDKNSDVSVIWNDPLINIDWGLQGRPPILSDKDANGLAFSSYHSPFRINS